MDVFLAERQTEFAFGLLNEVGSQFIEFRNSGEYDDDDENADYPTVECVVLGEI